MIGTVAILILAGTQVGAMLSVDLPGFRLQYSASEYVADAPTYGRTKTLNVDFGRELYVGYASITHNEGWGFSDDAARMGYRVGGLDVALRTNGFDASYSVPLSPSLSVGYFDSRWYGGAKQCDPYCEWSGPYLSIGTSW